MISKGTEIGCIATTCAVMFLGTAFFVFFWGYLIGDHFKSDGLKVVLILGGWIASLAAWTIVAVRFSVKALGQRRVQEQSDDEALWWKQRIGDNSPSKAPNRPNKAWEGNRR